MKHQKRLIVLGLALGLVIGTVGRAGAGLNLGGTLKDAIKVLGIGFAVKTFGPQINQGINMVLMQKSVERQGGTKVVPILSVGQGAYIGAAQVMGPETEVAKVKAVIQGEVGTTAFSKEVRLKALVPVNSINPFESLPKPMFKGIGISAVIDFDV